MKEDVSTLGMRSLPYVSEDPDMGIVILVDEVRYDASYDDYYKAQIVINSNPTSAEIFKARLGNTKSK